MSSIRGIAIAIVYIAKRGRIASYGCSIGFWIGWKMFPHIHVFLGKIIQRTKMGTVLLNLEVSMYLYVNLDLAVVVSKTTPP